MNRPTEIMALDVGGANLKAAHSCGMARSLPFALWRDPESLPSRLRVLMKDLPGFDSVLLTTTAELCDCFATKSQGVLAVLDAVRSATDGQLIAIWGTDGRFHDAGEIREQPRLAAAANWLALATVAAMKIGMEPGILVDIGSTTTDLIPLSHGRVAARGRTDTERLQTSELIYAGVRRTPLCSLATSLPFRSQPTGLAAELFATTLDIFLTLGEICEKSDDRDTADGRPATRPAARDRLARMIGADREEFSEKDAQEFAEACRDVLLDRLSQAVFAIIANGAAKPAVAVVSGSGEFLARRLVERIFRNEVRVLSLSDLWSPAASEAACARALLELVEWERTLR